MYNFDPYNELLAIYTCATYDWEQRTNEINSALYFSGTSNRIEIE